MVIWRADIVPTKIVVRLPYVESLNRAPATFQDDYQFNLNSLFDPNRTGTGHQPLGYDQWATFYNRYRVLRVFARASVVNNGTIPVRFTLAATNSTTGLTVLNSEEQPYSVSGIVGINTGASVAEIGCIVNLPALNGRTPGQYSGSDNTAATFGATPAEQQILHFFAASIDGSNIVYQTNVRLVYEVELFDPLELAES